MNANSGYSRGTFPTPAAAFLLFPGPRAMRGRGDRRCQPVCRQGRTDTREARRAAAKLSLEFPFRSSFSPWMGLRRLYGCGTRPMSPAGNYSDICTARRIPELASGRVRLHRVPPNEAELDRIRSLALQSRGTVRRRKGWNAEWLATSAHSCTLARPGFGAEAFSALPTILSASLTIALRCD